MKSTPSKGGVWADREGRSQQGVPELRLPHPSAFNPKVLSRTEGHPLVITEEPDVETPSGMSHGKSSRTERDGGEAKAGASYKAQKGLRAGSEAAAGLLQSPPRRAGPSGAAAEPKYQCQNMWERQGGCEVGLCSYNASHRIYDN